MTSAAPSSNPLPPKPLPRPDLDSLPFWQGVQVGELRVQRCGACGRLRWPAREICPACHAPDGEWIRVSGRGTIASWLRTHQVFFGAFKPDVPYVTVQVRLDEQPDLLMLGGWAGAGEPKSGAAVEAVFVPAGEGATLVHWRPATEG